PTVDPDRGAPNGAMFFRERQGEPRDRCWTRRTVLPWLRRGRMRRALQHQVRRRRSRTPRVGAIAGILALALAGFAAAGVFAVNGFSFALTTAASGSPPPTTSPSPDPAPPPPPAPKPAPPPPPPPPPP